MRFSNSFVHVFLGSTASLVKLILPGRQDVVPRALNVWLMVSLPTLSPGTVKSLTQRNEQIIRWFSSEYFNCLSKLKHAFCSPQPVHISSELTSFNSEKSSPCLRPNQCEVHPHHQQVSPNNTCIWIQYQRSTYLLLHSSKGISHNTCNSMQVNLKSKQHCRPWPITRETKWCGRREVCFHIRQTWVFWIPHLPFACWAGKVYNFCQHQHHDLYKGDD